MVSRIFFTIDGTEYECNVRKPYGENFSYEKEPIEVDSPKELKEIINYGQFRDEVEKYYRKLVGANATMINIQGGTNIRMQNNTFKLIHKTKIDKAGLTGAW